MIQRAYNALPDRNLAMYILRQAGWTYERIAHLFERSVSRVYWIINGLEWRAHFQAYEAQRGSQ